MNNIIMEKKIDSPRIVLNYAEGLIEIDGKSYTEDMYTFYSPVELWFKEYFNGSCQEKTTVNIKLIYFNSATSQILYNLFDIIANSSCNLDTITINWFYFEDNEDSYEDYEDMLEEFPKLKLNPVVFKEK